MKSLKIKYLKELDNVDIQDANWILKEVDSQYIDNINWPDQFDTLPACNFWIARSVSALYIHFSINEENVQAIYETDHDPVWQDSCVEFFCKIPDSERYINFEFNCIGTCLAAIRKGRNVEVVPFSMDKMQKIERYATLGSKAFSTLKGETFWELTVKIPFELMGMDQNQLPKKLFANFYKCADASSKPHYVSWNKIDTPTPDFHRPEFFGDLEF